MASVVDMKREMQLQIDRIAELADRLSDLADNTDGLMRNGSVRYAAETSRLDHVTLILTVLGIIIAFGGSFAFYEVQHRARATARAAVDAQVPGEVLSYMKKNSGMMLSDCLKDPEIVSAPQAEIIRLGIRDAPAAGSVDTDAERRETV